MTEAYKSDELRAQRFLETHVYVPADFVAYQKRVLDDWSDEAVVAWESGNPVQPLWMRRNGESPSEFAVHIDYLMPVPEQFLLVGSIDIADDYVEVWLPASDGSEAPVVVTSEPYDIEALERAIGLVEASAATPAYGLD